MDLVKLVELVELVYLVVPIVLIFHVVLITHSILLLLEILLLLLATIIHATLHPGRDCPTLILRVLVSGCVDEQEYNNRKNN